MPGTRIVRSAAAASAAIVIVIAACAGRTGLAESDVLASPAEAPFYRILVIGMDRHADLRDRMEAEIVEKLRSKGVEAVASTSYFAFSSAPPSREEVQDLVKRERIDGILVARLTQRGTEYRQVPLAAADPFFPPLGFYDFYWRAWPRVYAQSYLEAVSIAALELRLYEASGAGTLVFRATSDDFELDGARRAIAGVSGVLADALANARLIA